MPPGPHHQWYGMPQHTALHALQSITQWLTTIFFSQNPSNSSRLGRKQTHTRGRLQSIKPYRIEEMMQPVRAVIPRLHSKNPWSIINSLPNSTSCFTSFTQQFINLNVRAWHNYQLDAQPMEQCQILLNHTRWCQIKIRFNLSFTDSELNQPTSDLKLHIFLSDILWSSCSQSEAN